MNLKKLSKKDLIAEVKEFQDVVSIAGEELTACYKMEDLRTRQIDTLLEQVKNMGLESDELMDELSNSEARLDHYMEAAATLITLISNKTL